MNYILNKCETTIDNNFCLEITFPRPLSLLDHMKMNNLIRNLFLVFYGVFLVLIRRLKT